MPGRLATGARARFVGVKISMAVWHSGETPGSDEAAGEGAVGLE
jgi:hypothetical protein